MSPMHRWRAATLLTGTLAIAACGQVSEFDNEAPGDEGAAHVEAVKGSDAARVVLTPRAAQRLGIRTAHIRQGHAGGKLIPYAAILYDAEGRAFTYTNPEPLVFVRRPVTVERIGRSTALASRAPRAGTAVVTVGAAELLGTEYGVEE
jgi:hypothetical protein